MSSYVNLFLNRNMYQEIIDDLMIYCSKLDNYWEMENAVHLIDALDEIYQEDMNKQNREYIEWQEYEKLFNERFENVEFRDDDNGVNEKGINEYMNFNKVNKVLKDYEEGGVLNILDDKNRFFLILDIINSFDM